MNGWFANISVNLKLGLGFGLVLLLTGLLALTGWTSLGSLIDRSNWMSDITKLNSDLTNLRVARLQYMLTNGDDTSAANVLDKLDAFGAQQQHLVNTFKSPENLKLLREQGETIAKYRVSLEKMRKAYKTGLAAREALNQNARQASEALAAIEAVSRDALARTSGDTATLQQFLAISQAKEQLVQLRLDVRSYIADLTSDAEQTVTRQVEKPWWRSTTSSATCLGRPPESRRSSRP